MTFIIVRLGKSNYLKMENRFILDRMHCGKVNIFSNNPPAVINRSPESKNLYPTNDNQSYILLAEDDLDD